MVFFKDFFSSINYETLTYREPVACSFSREGGVRCDKRTCADVMIADYQMPRMNGLELFQEQSRMGCKMPTKNKAIMTGLVNGELQKKAEKAGVAFFIKPVNIPEFSAWLAECEQRSDISQPLASRRKEMRHAINYEIRCRVYPDQILSCTTVDISDSGFRIKLASPLSAKQAVLIEAGLLPVVACRTASVRWIKKDRDGSYQAGLSCH